MKPRTLSLRLGYSKYIIARIQFLLLALLLAINSNAQFITASGSGPFNGPCNAGLYDFGGDDNNVPCGPSANTTSSVPINGQGPNNTTGSNIINSDLNCGTTTYNGSDDVLWVSFVIQEGGSWEWQTVPGADKFTWNLFYATDPVDMTSEETSASGCDELVKVDCGDQFTGWKIGFTPDPTKRWRFYLAFIINKSADKDDVGDGVVKIRKSCGLACEGDAAIVSIADPGCEEEGTVDLTASPNTYNNYIWSDATGVLAAPPTSTFSYTTDALSIGTYTYTVTAFDDGECPGSAQITFDVGNCCDAEAGQIVNNSDSGTFPATLCRGGTTLNTVTFSASFIDPDMEPDLNLYSYALFLVDMSGNIVDPPGPIDSDASIFLFSNLPNGMYTLYGLSYLNNQTGGTTAETYINGLSLGNISEIIGDDNDTSSGGDGGGTLCLDLVSGGDANKVTIVGGDCGDLSGPSTPTPLNSPTNNSSSNQ